MERHSGQRSMCWRDPRPTFRFVRSVLSLLRMHWDLERFGVRRLVPINSNCQKWREWGRAVSTPGSWEETSVRAPPAVQETVAG